LARGAGAGPAPTGPARSPAAGEMKLPRCQANETRAAARQTKPAPLSGERNLRRCQANKTRSEPACAAGNSPGKRNQRFDGGTSPIRIADKKRSFAAANLTRQRFS
ncbi:hypothetical protein, partial [Pantoea septica]